MPTPLAQLASVKDFVGEMIVVDTGSTDDTPNIAARLGARVEHFPWAAPLRPANESIKYARGRWIFWMDSDDTMDQANASRLRQLTRREPDPSIMGFVMEVHCPSPGRRDAPTIVHHVKMFRNLPELRFERLDIHEQIIAPIRKIEGEIVRRRISPLCIPWPITHRREKPASWCDLRILEEERKERPDSFTFFNLGMTYVDAERFAESAESLEKSISMSLPTERQLRKSYSLLIFALSKLKRANEAMKACIRWELFPQDAELSFARRTYCTTKTSSRSGAGLQGDFAHERGLAFHEQHARNQGVMARQNLAVVYNEMGLLSKAEEQLRLMLQEEPDSKANCIVWSTVCSARKLREAEKYLLQIIARWPNDGSAHHNLGTLHSQRGNLTAAIASLRESIRHRPDLSPSHAPATGLCVARERQSERRRDKFG